MLQLSADSPYLQSVALKDNDELTSKDFEEKRPVAISTCWTA